MHGSIWEMTGRDVIRAMALPAAYVINWLIAVFIGFDVCEAERNNAEVERMEKFRERMRKEF
jgi:hypothetical protein